MKLKFTFLLFVLSAFFTVSLIIANVIAGKLWAAPFNITLTCGVFVFPIVYIIGDVVPEVYGLKIARRVIFLGFLLNLYAVIFFWLTIRAPFPPFFANQDAYSIVLGFTPRLLLASFCGYLIGTNANAWVLVQVKRLTKARWLWMRTISSTLVGETLDSIVFITIAFYGILPNNALLPMIFYQASFKTLYEIVATPLTYLVIRMVKKSEGLAQDAVGFVVA